MWCGVVESELEKISRDSFSSELPISRNLKSTILVIHAENIQKIEEQVPCTMTPSTSTRRGWGIVYCKRWVAM